LAEYSARGRDSLLDWPEIAAVGKLWQGAGRGGATSGADKLGAAWAPHGSTIGVAAVGVLRANLLATATR
jgi:hypothetical protein